MRLSVYWMSEWASEWVSGLVSVYRVCAVRASVLYMLTRVSVWCLVLANRSKLIRSCCCCWLNVSDLDSISSYSLFFFISVWFLAIVSLAHVYAPVVPIMNPFRLSVSVTYCLHMWSAHKPVPEFDLCTFCCLLSSSYHAVCFLFKGSQADSMLLLLHRRYLSARIMWSQLSISLHWPYKTWLVPNSTFWPHIPLNNCSPCQGVWRIQYTRIV